MEDLLTLRLATPIHGGESRDEEDRDESSEGTSHLHDEDRLEARLENMAL